MLKSARKEGACLLLHQVSSRPLKVAVEHLKDLPYSSSDDIVKATYMEAVATLKDLLAQHPIYREQLQTSFQFGSDFQDLSRLTDMAAALTSAGDTALQAILAELSVPERCPRNHAMSMCSCVSSMTCRLPSFMHQCWQI